MGFLDKFLESKEETDYRSTVAEVRAPLDGLVAAESADIRDFFKKIWDTAEESLRVILFTSPETLGLKKALTREEVDFWFRRVTLALVAYSYCFFSVDEQSAFAQSSFYTYWQRVLGSYNKIFNESATVDAINHYAAGMIEGGEKKYLKSGDEEKAFELMLQDYAVIATELLKEIWREDIDQKTLDVLRTVKPGQHMGALDLKVQRVAFLGSGIWEAHLEIVKPFLPKLPDYQT